MLEKLEHNKQLILFDGVCNLCNSSVQYVIKRDKKDRFRYAALQSEIGQDIIEKFHIDTSKTDSIILYSNEKGISYKSTVALKIASNLGVQGPPRAVEIQFLFVHRLWMNF